MAKFLWSLTNRCYLSFCTALSLLPPQWQAVVCRHGTDPAQLSTSSSMFHLRIYPDFQSTTYLETFLHENGFYFPEVPQAEYLALSDQLKQLRASLSNVALDAGESKYYKVKFQDALDVVQHRRALLKEGYAYVEKNDLISLVLLEYRCVNPISISSFLGVTSIIVLLLRSSIFLNWKSKIRELPI